MERSVRACATAAVQRGVAQLGHAASVIVAVVHIRVVRVRVLQRSMHVGVGVRLHRI